MYYFSKNLNERKTGLLALLLSSLLGLCIAGNALAGIATAPLQVTAFYGATCDITSPTVDLPFGNIVSPTVQATLTVNLHITCSSSQTFGLWIPLGANATGSQRRMVNTSSNGGYINYDLYSDAALTTPYPTAMTMTGYTGSNAGGYGDPRFMVGRIQSGQTVTAGYYADTIVINLSF